jgi:hypothetical protein
MSGSKNLDDFHRLWNTLSQLLAEHGPEDVFGALSAILAVQARGLRLAGRLIPLIQVPLYVVSEAGRA